MTEATAGVAVMVVWSLEISEAWDTIAKARVRPLWNMLLIPDELRMMMVNAIQVVENMREI